VESTYRTMVKALRASLPDETDCDYLIHTPQGVINVKRWNYSIPGFVVVSGKDENSAQRFIVFPEDQISSFPLEVRRRSSDTSKEALGFKPSVRGNTEDQTSARE
jgi:hypothetical protein